jgi:hypothetical protein
VVTASATASVEAPAAPVSSAVPASSAK